MKQGFVPLKSVTRKSDLNFGVPRTACLLADSGFYANRAEADDGEPVDIIVVFENFDDAHRQVHK